MASTASDGECDHPLTEEAFRQSVANAAANAD
jgi:hypothetical protein